MATRGWTSKAPRGVSRRSCGCREPRTWRTSACWQRYSKRRLKLRRACPGRPQHFLSHRPWGDSAASDRSAETRRAEIGFSGAASRNPRIEVPGRHSRLTSGNPPVISAASKAAAGSSPSLSLMSAGFSGPTTISRRRLHRRTGRRRRETARHPPDPGAGRGTREASPTTAGLPGQAGVPPPRRSRTRRRHLDRGLPLTTESERTDSGSPAVTPTGGGRRRAERATLGPDGQPRRWASRCRRDGSSRRHADNFGPHRHLPQPVTDRPDHVQPGPRMSGSSRPKRNTTPLSYRGTWPTLNASSTRPVRGDLADAKPRYRA